MKAITSLLVLSLLVPAAAAQTTLGTIRGLVTDPSGATVGTVNVVVRNVDTNIQHRAVSNDSGLYEVTNLIPGRYSVTAEYSGFRTVVVSNIILETSATVRADIRLEVGELATSINVEATAPVINTESADVAAVRNQQVMLRLPLNVRGQFDGFYYSMLVTTPGAIRGQGSNFSFAGARGFQWNTTVDGTSQRSPLFANSIGPAQSNMEMTQEIRIQLSNDKAESGLPGGFYATSKSGANDLHGSAFYYYANSGLTARNTFSTSVPYRSENDYGGSLGGPIIKDRTFYFATYERFPLKTERIFNPNVPTVAFRSGDFSSLLPGTTVRDPLTGQPFPGNQIPASRLSSVSLKVQERFFPLPNSGAANTYQQNWQGVGPQSQYKTQVEGRVDHKFTDANSLFVRFSWNRTGANVFDTNLPTVPLRDQDRRTSTFTVSDNHIFNPGLINEFRFGIMKTKNPTWNQLDGPALVAEFGLQGLTWHPDLAWGAPTFGFTNFTGFGGGGQNPSERIYQAVNNVTWTRGAHTIKTGVDFRFNRATNYPGGTSFPVNQFGTFGFTNAFSGFDYADFLLGLPQSASRAVAAPLYNNLNTDFAVFLQDDWKVGRKLTLNVGVRYEYNPPYHEKDGNFFNFDAATGRVVVPDEESLSRVSPLFPQNLVPIVTAAQAGLPTSLYFTDLNNIVPRFGFAYRPFDAGRTVLRGGYGVYVDDLTSSLWGLGNGGPYISSESFTNSVTNGVPLFQFPSAFPAGFGAIGAQSFSPIDAHFLNPYIQQWNLTVEHEIFDMGIRVSYIGTNSRKLAFVRNINQPPASGTTFNNNLRPFPALRDILLRENGGVHNYNSLHVVAERKTRGGLYYQLGWTWASNLTDSQSDSEGGSRPEDAFLRSREYGNVDYTPRHRVTGSLLYDLPFGAGRRYFSGMSGISNALLGGWTISSILTTQTGQFFSPSFDAFDTSNTNTVGGRPDRVADGNLPSSERTIDRWFDASAFRVPGDLNGDGRPDVAVARFGNSGPNVLETPGVVDVSAGMHKEFRVTEKYRAIVQATFRNVLNHPIYGNPATNIRATNVGTIRSLNGLYSPRAGQLAVRLEF
jgi:Carboxypeptidase regulatory-like domain